MSQVTQTPQGQAPYVPAPAQAPQGATPPAQPVVQPVPPVAAPAAPGPQPAPGASQAEIEQWRQRAAKLEADIRALKSASDRRQHEVEMQYQQRLAQAQQQAMQTQTAGMTDEDRLKYEAQRLAQRNAELESYVAQQQAIANRESTIAAYQSSYGVPREVLEQYAQDPQTMAWAVMEYQAGRLRPQQPQPPVAPAPGTQPGQSWNQPAQGVVPVAQPQPTPQPAVHPTSHTAAAQLSTVQENLEALADRTSKNKESTVLEALLELKKARQEKMGQ